MELLKDRRQHGGLPPYIEEEEFSSMYSCSIDTFFVTDTTGCGICQDHNISYITHYILLKLNYVYVSCMLYIWQNLFCSNKRYISLKEQHQTSKFQTFMVWNKANQHGACGPQAAL
jgi:hypothetical protein